MANYAVNDWSSTIDKLSDVLAELETQVETIDTGKTIRLISVLPVPGSNGKFQAVLVTDA